MITIIDGELYISNSDRNLLLEARNEKIYKIKEKYVCVDCSGKPFCRIISKEQLKQKFQNITLNKSEVENYEEIFGVNLLEKESFYKEVKREGE